MLGKGCICLGALNKFRFCLFRTFLTNFFRQVMIFDDLFTRDELLEWRSHLLRFNPTYRSFDPDPLEDHDNVQWIRTYSVGRLHSSMKCRIF